MDSNASSYEETWDEFRARQEAEPLPRPKEPPHLVYIRSLCDPTLQKYIDLPPGVGKSVIYVIVNVKDGKAYVGKHCHGVSGDTFRSTRFSRFFNPKDNDTTYKANAVRKHGTASFVAFIIWHGDTCDEDERECHWISPEGLHTIKSNGGWGYNAKDGGEGGAHAPCTIVKIKATMATKESKAKRSAISKARVEREIAAGMTSLADHGRKYWENATEEQKAERNRTIKESMATDESKKKRMAISQEQAKREEEIDPGYRSRRARARVEREAAEGKPSIPDRAREYWENATEEQKAERNRKTKEAMATDESKEKRSEITKRQLENETDEQKAKRIRKLTETKNQPEHVEKTRVSSKAQFEREEIDDPGGRSRRAKAQAEREAAAGAKPLQDRGRDAALAKRAEMLASLTGAALQRRILKNAREDRKTAKKTADLSRLRSIPGHENDKAKDLPAARKAGLLGPKPPTPPLVAAPPPTPLLEAAPPPTKPPEPRAGEYFWFAGHKYLKLESSDEED